MLQYFVFISFVHAYYLCLCMPIPNNLCKMGLVSDHCYHPTCLSFATFLSIALWYLVRKAQNGQIQTLYHPGPLDPWEAWTAKRIQQGSTITLADTSRATSGWPRHSLARIRARIQGIEVTSLSFFQWMNLCHLSSVSYTTGGSQSWLVIIANMTFFWILEF